MRGTTTFKKRYVALKGIIGRQVACAIYANRPSACHNFKASWEADGANENCDRARNRYDPLPFNNAISFF